MDPYFSPLVAEDLSNLPKTYIMTMEQDVLRDDGLLYEHRLREAGNDVTHVHYSHGIHGLTILLDALDDGHEVAHAMLDFMEEEL